MKSIYRFLEARLHISCMRYISKAVPYLNSIFVMQILLVLQLLWAEGVMSSYAPKLMPPVLFCWLTMSEVDVGGMEVETEPSHQCFITFTNSENSYEQRANSGCENGERWVMCFSSSDSDTGWCRFLWVQLAGSSSLVVTMLKKIVFCSWEFALLNSVIVLFASLVVSMETTRHCFWSDISI